MDDSYHAFFWSLLIQHPSVKIGTLFSGQLADVYVPKQPRTSKKREAANDDQGEQPSMCGLENIPDSHLPLEQLVTKYGDRLRVAVDPDTCLVALTGTHTRVCYPHTVPGNGVLTVLVACKTQRHGVRYSPVDSA